jgi:excisionase family DNA binding protein
MIAPERAMLNSSEAAEYLGISVNTLYRIEKRGDLQPFRTPGGHRRYDLRMLDDYLESTRSSSASRIDGGQQQ